MQKQKRDIICKFRVGVHASIAGGLAKSVERAVSLGCKTIQIFSHNPRQWRKSPVKDDDAKLFSILRQKHDVNPVFIHASYLINLASLSSQVLRKSIELLSYELMVADILGADSVILHTGSASGDSEKKARFRAVKAILQAIGAGQFKASLLLENTAGERGDITSSIQTLAEIIHMCDCDRIGGICIDTCHAFSSGYDLTSEEGIEKLLSEIQEHIGLDKLKLIHLNDSKRPLGSGIDRHEHIGKGFIGTGGFKKILSDRRITRIPMILETPKKTETDDKNNLKKVFHLIADTV